MEKSASLYNEIYKEMKEIDRRTECLCSCFMVISQPEMLDSMNFQLLALKTRRKVLLEQLKSMVSEQDLLGK